MMLQPFTRWPAKRRQEWAVWRDDDHHLFPGKLVYLPAPDVLAAINKGGVQLSFFITPSSMRRKATGR